MITVKNLSFSYSQLPFIENMNFQVRSGEIFGFLGPSGAGKSTLQKILIGMLPKYKGSVSINNNEIRNKSDQFYESIGVDFEFPSFYEKFTALENLKFFGSLYDCKLIPIEQLLEIVGLSQHANKKVAGFSKGMKSRLNFARSIIHQPKVLFLDEPTSGLDPSNSQVMKNIILDLKNKGVTIILTTHNMHDATELCDRVAFIVDGNIKAMDTPHNLIMSRRYNEVTYSYLENQKELNTTIALDKISTDKKLQSLIQANALLSIHSNEPTLDNIFSEINREEITMKLKGLILGDIRQQYKYGFYALYTLFTLVYITVLRILPMPWKELCTTTLIFSDPVLIGLMFMGAIILFEKSEKVMQALAVSPISIHAYILSKVISIGLISLLSGVLIALFSGMEHSYIHLAVGIMLGSALFTGWNITFCFYFNHE